MKKSNFVAMILSTIGGILTSLGMCMCLIPEWNMFNKGMVVGVIGLIVLLIMIIVYRKMEGKESIKLQPKNILAMIGAIGLGIGMCFTMVWDNMILGIIVGIVGIVIIFSTIPVYKGLK